MQIVGRPHKHLIIKLLLQTRRQQSDPGFGEINDYLNHL